MIMYTIGMILMAGLISMVMQMGQTGPALLLAAIHQERDH